MHHVARSRPVAALALSIILAGCGTTTPTVAPPTSQPSASPTVAPSATPSPSPAIDTATWDPAGSLALARASTHAVALADGRVLVVGNDNICEPGGAWDDSVRAEVFDPANGTWTSTGRLNAPRDGFVAIALPDGRVLVTGGLTSAEPAEGVFGAYSSVKLYDPATGTWSAAGLMKTARTEAVAASLPDGRVLVAGGAYVDKDGSRTLASAEIYDPDTDGWSPTGALRMARRGAQAVTLADGRILVVGGDGAGSDLGPPPEIYDPDTGTWTTVSGGTLRLPDSGFALVALPDGGALVVGGLEQTDEGLATTAAVERLDARATTWLDAAPLPAAVTSPAAVLLGDGRVLVAGGVTAGIPQDGDGPPILPAINDAALYEPGTDTWTPTAPLPAPREGGTFVTLSDRTVLLVGGDAGYLDESVPSCPEPVAEAVRYVPENLASFPPPRTPATAAVVKSTVPRATAKPADSKKAAASVNAFGVDLYKRMLEDGTLDPKKDAVFSPTSIALALGMARAGAEGETASQMDDVLHVSGWDALRKGLNSLSQALASRDATWKDDRGRAHALKLRIANAAFAQRGWAIVQDYLDAIASAFGAGLRLVDYIGDPEAQRKLINAWVKKQTADRIPELIPKVEPPIINESTRLVMVNAIYLKANWEIEFGGYGRRTEPQRFTRLDGSRVKVPTMELWGQQTVPYATGKGWKATELRYRGAKGSTPLAMTLVLPDNLGAFEDSLNAKKLAGIVSKLDSQRELLERLSYAPEPPDAEQIEWMDCGTYAYSLDLFMPKFSIDTASRLKKSLSTIGMPAAFELATADFSGIHVLEDESDRIYIGEVVHQANIDVDEKGTEAAAATAVVDATTGGCGGPSAARTVTLRLNRPFLFVLRDVETGAILFMGRVVDPSAK